MRIEKQLTIIAAISIIITLILYFALDRKDDSGFFNTAFELLLMTGLTFLVLAINFFALRFFFRKIFGLFSKK